MSYSGQTSLGGEGESLTSGLSISSSAELFTQEERVLDYMQKCRVHNYVKMELFEKGYLIINKETYKEKPRILAGATRSAGIPPEQFLLYKTSIKKTIKEKLNNLRSYVKKEAKRLFKGM